MSDETQGKEENTMNGEKNNDEDIIKAKLKEMQKYISLLQELLKSMNTGENNTTKHIKVKMMYEIITGKIPCTNLVTLMQIEKTILKVKEIKLTRVTQDVAKISKDLKSSKDNALEVIDLDSSDDDDVEIVSYTAPEPKRLISGTEDRKVVTSDINKNNENVPDLTEEAEKREESLGITLKSQISSSPQSKKIKINLMPKETLTSVIGNTCDYINEEPISPSASIPNKNSCTISTKNILNASKNTVEVSSTTLQVKERASKIIECNKSSTIAKSKLSDFESGKKLINDEDISVSTTNDNDSPRKYSNILKSIDLPKKSVENDIENIQDVDLFDKVDIYFSDESCSSEAEKKEEIVSSTSELTVFEVSEDCEKSRAEVSSSCNKCNPQVYENSLQTSPVSQDPLSPMPSSNISRSSKDEEGNKDVEKTSLLNQDTFASSQESSVLWINDAETEEFIKKLDLEIVLQDSSLGKINNEKVLTKDASENSKCNIPTQRLSRPQSSTRCKVPRYRSEVLKPLTSKLRIRSSKKRAYSTSSIQRLQGKISSRYPSQILHSLDTTRIKIARLKNQVHALKLAMPTTLKEGPTSPLQDRLINAGLLSERRSSLKHTEQISCAVTTTEDPQNPNESQKLIEPESCVQPLSTVKDNSSKKISNNLEDISNEKIKLLSEESPISPTKAKSTTRIPLSEKSSENEEKDNSQFLSVVLSNSEKVLGVSSSPLKDSPNEEELSKRPMHKEHKETLNSEVLIELSDILNNFNFETNKTISDTRNESGLSSFPFCTKGISNLAPVKDKQSVVDYEQNQAEIPSTTYSVVEAAEQTEKPSLERQIETLKSGKQELNSEEWNKVLNSLDIQKIFEQNKNVFQQFLISSANENSPDEAPTKADTHEESCPLKISQLDKWADKSLDELHEIRFQLEKKMGVDLGIILYPGQNETSRNISDQQLIPMENAMNEKNIIYEPPQPQPMLHYDVPCDSFKQPIPNVLCQNLGLSSGLRSNDPRLQNRLKLLYRKTHDPVGQPDSSQTNHCESIADKILRSQDQNARNEMLQTSATNTTKNLLSPPSSSKRLQNYNEYKILKQEAETARKKAVETANRDHQLEMEVNREKQKSENKILKNFEIESEATPKKIERKAHQVKLTPEKEKWKTPDKNQQFKPDKLKTLKVSKQRRNTIQIETEPRKGSIIKPETTSETLKDRRDRRKTIQIEAEPNSEAEARKQAAIEIVYGAHQLELESERQKQETLKPAKKARRQTREKSRKISVAETSNKIHPFKLKAKPVLKIGKERRNTIQVETVLEAEIPKQTSPIEYATRKTQVRRERRKTIQEKLETASEAETTKTKITVETANKALSQKTTKINKEKHKMKELETASKETEMKVTSKKPRPNTPEGEKSGPIISNIEDIEIKIATRKRRKPILESSSDSESEGTHCNNDDIEKIRKPRRKKKISVLKSSSESKADKGKLPKISIPNIRRRRKTINCNEDNAQLNEFQEQNRLKLDISNPKEIKEFACRLIKPLLKEKPFEMFQNILENSNLKNNRRKSALPSDSTVFRVSPRELKALYNDLNNSFIAEDVRKINGRRRNTVHDLKVLIAKENAENSENFESEEVEIDERNKPNLSDEDYDTDNFEEHVSRKKKEEEIHRIIKNPPVVLVPKLAPEDLKKSIKPAKVENLVEATTSNVDQHLLEPLKSVQIKHRCVRRKSQCKTKSKENKNTNPIWHYKDSFFSTSCILCSRKSSQLVEHYLESHPHDEIYISRLPQADVHALEENPGRATRHLTKQNQYVAECFFCGQTIKGRFDKLSHHYATHTGEFPYECSACNFMSCYKSDMIKHTRTECKEHAKLQKYYTYDKNVTKINLYVCTKCNYMQLHEANVVRHLRKEHDCNKINKTDVKVLTLLEVVDDPPQNIPIVNEPILSDPKSDEEIIFEVRPGGTLMLPIMLKKEDYDIDSAISDASIDVKPETLLIDPCLDQSIKTTDKCVNEIPVISNGLRPGRPELPKTTTHVGNVMTIMHNWDPKENNSSKENRGENKTDDIEELLRILTCTPSSTPNPSNSFKTVDQYNATEDLNPLVPVNVESQEVMEATNQKELTFDQLNKSTECRLQSETEMTQDVQIQENCIPVIEIPDDEDEKTDLVKIETEAPYMKESEDSALRLEHFGYQEYRDSEYTFHCLIEKCDFGATVSFQILQDHVKKEHNVMWSGKCNVCKDKLTTLPGKQPIEEELNHMISVHIKELYDSQNSDGNHVINLLKPWLSETKSHKKKILCESMVSKTLLTDQYKCMGDDCSFTSDSKEQMSKHLATHELKIIGKSDSQRPWLECCYCEHYADKALQILEHVDCEHSSSIFQCSQCFYRSCSLVNVKNHQHQHHPSNDGKNTTLECIGKVKSLTSDYKRIQKLKEDNIKAVSCSVCTQKYIRKDLMIEHFKMVHKESEIGKDMKMGLFSCIFCNFEDDKIKKMCCHMADKHPEELLLIGVRGIKENSVQDDISSIAVPETTEWGNIKPQPNDISASGGLADTEQQLETNAVQKFKNNLMDLEDLKKLLNPQSTCDNSCEKQNSEIDKRALTELCTKMGESLKYFIKPKILHPCGICSKEINLENQWTDHFNTAHSTISRDAVWQCPQCPTMSSFWTYPVHFINHHIEEHKIYFCYFCASQFYNFPAANKHLMTHTNKEEEAKCTFFEQSQESNARDDEINEIGIVIPATNNSSVVDVIKHMIEISKKRKDEQSKLTNFIDVTIDLNKNICDENYPEYVPEKQRYICSSCNNIWIDEKAFEKHFKAAHRTILVFKCPHCDLLISPSSYKAVRDHFRLHSQEIIYKCCLCNMFADNIELLTKHIKNYKQQNVPIARITRENKIVKYTYKVVHFSPLSTNRSSDEKIQCFFCPTRVDTYKSFDMHLSNVHKLGRTYKCFYCTYQGDIKNVNSHIKEIHIRSDPKKFRFISKTVFLTIENQEENFSHLPNAQKIESTNNASCSKIVVVDQDVSRKRKHSDISDRPASDQNYEVKKRLKPQNLEADNSENSDPTVNDRTNGNYHMCNLCTFKSTNYEDYMIHIKTHSQPDINSVSTSAHSVQSYTTTTSVIQTTPLPSSSNKAPPTGSLSILLKTFQEAPKDKLRLVPMDKLLKPISTNQNNAPQPSTYEEPQKRPLSTRKTVVFPCSCFHCFASFNSYDLLRKHWELSTCPSDSNRSYRFRIPRIEGDFISRHMVNKIIQIASMKSLYYECSECGSNFFNKDFCIHHMASKLLAPVYYFHEQKEILYGCDECSIFYSREEQAIQHIAKHTFRFSCLFCPAAYRSLPELQLHYCHTHQINENKYKYSVKSPRNMEIFQQMLVVFPCGLVVTKDYLKHTCWGNVKTFTKLIDKSIK